MDIYFQKTCLSCKKLMIKNNTHLFINQMNYKNNSCFRYYGRTAILREGILNYRDTSRSEKMKVQL